MTPTQYLIEIDEALGNQSNNTTLAVIYRQQRIANNVTDEMVQQRVEELLQQFPIQGVDFAQARAHVLNRLQSDTMDWEAFTVGMKIVGATSLIVSVK